MRMITFLPFQVEVPFQDGQSVLEVALKAKIPVDHSCGGMGSCTTCLVRIEKSSSPPSPRTELETEMADMKGFCENERLSCQLLATDGLIVRVRDF